MKPVELDNCSCPPPLCYELKVKGLIPENWSEWFEGFELTSLGEGESLLTGKVTDQSALHGVLSKIRDFNLVLLSVSLK